jgi:hypothetical protein
METLEQLKIDREVLNQRIEKLEKDPNNEKPTDAEVKSFNNYF